MARLLLIVPTLSSYKAFLSDFAEAAISQGHEVYVATRLKLLDGRKVDKSKHLSAAVHFHPIDFPRGANIGAILVASRKLRLLVDKIKPDWMQAHFSVAALILAVAKRPGGPFASCVIHGLASTATRGLSRFLSWLGERYAISQLDEMWVLTQDDFAVVNGWDSSKARLQETFGFGCRLEQFNPGQCDAEWCRQRKKALLMDTEAFTLIYVGRLVAFKGFDKVVHAYWKLKSQGTDVQLILLGTFDTHHPCGLSKAEIKKLEADPSVLLPGWQESVADWLGIADLCVFPSEREGMPVCLMESLAMGVPVLTTDSRGCRDVVRNGLDGFVMRDASVANIAKQVDILIKDESALAVLSQAARQGRSRFDRQFSVTEQLAALNVKLAK